MEKKEYKTNFGIQSNTEDNKHIFMLDFDNKDERILINLLKHIQREFYISDLYIIKTENGFNVFSLDKLEMEYLVNILANYSAIDELFIALAIKRGFFVLRMSGTDRQFYGIIPSLHNVYEKSLAHFRFFADVKQYPINYYPNFDNNNEFKIIAFRSVKHGYETRQSI